MKREHWITLIATGLLITAFLLLYSTTTSPLYPNSYGVDSAFNRFMGLMVRRGKTLYSEIWDNKGPVLFWLQAIGTLKGTHNANVTLTFLMQIVSLFLTTFFLCKADRAAHLGISNPLRFLLMVLCSLAVLSVIIDGGNLSEEWSLPMIGCGLYLLIKYAVNVTENPLHPRRYAFIHGICIGLLAFIRINNAISICAGLLAVGIYLIYRRKWHNLFENILFGLLGIAVITVPICLYFLSKGALGDMIYGVFLYNLKYAAQRTHKSFSGTEWLIRFLPILVSFLIWLIHLLRIRKPRFIDVMLLLILVSNGWMLWSSNAFWHYYIIFFPVFLLVLLLYVDFRTIPELVLSLVVLFFFIPQDIPLLAAFPEAQEAPDRFAYAAAIPEEEKSSAMALYVSPEVYLNSGLIPCSRYAAYHFAHFPVDPDMRAEFIENMQTAPPNWIIYLSGYEGIIPEMQELLEERYEATHEEYDVTYYRLLREGYR